MGWLACIAGYAVGLLLLRALLFGRIINIWVFLGDVDLAALAVYLMYVGRRAISRAKGTPTPKARFGYGKILLGASLLFSSANSHFHLLPGRDVIKPLEPSNDTQAISMKVTTIVINIGCALLVISGIWQGLRTARMGASATELPPASSASPHDGTR